MNLAMEGEAWRRINRWAPLLIKVVAIAWAAWVVAGLAWLLTGHDRSALPAPLVQTHAVQRPRVDTSLLANLDLFGQAKTAETAGPNAPDTTLQLRLNGVFVNNADPKASSAIISDAAQSGSGKLYQVNDNLPGGATLAAVYEDRVLLKRGGVSDEVLRFPKTSLLNPNSPPPPLPAPPPEASAREMLGQAAAGMEASPDAYLAQMGLVRTGHGYEVGPSAPEKLTKELGLQTGDRIVSVNGQALGDITHDRELLMGLKNGGSATVVIQRGNQTLTINQKF